LTSTARHPDSSTHSDARRPSPLTLALRDIKLAHSVFALPFALLAVFLSAPAFRAGAPDARWGRLAGQLALVVVCMVLARTWAMLINRIADHRLDALNPRTARRAIASGALRMSDARFIALATGLAFILCTALFWVLYDNAWPLILSSPTLAWIAFYSVTKRFTALCHLFLGGALAFSPIAAAIAIDPASLTTTPAIWCIAAMVLTWVAGFDILYALQDLDFDRTSGLHSVPALLGAGRAAWVSRFLHTLAFGALVGACLVEPRFGLVFALATAGVGVLLITEHVILVQRGLAGLPVAFFLINGVVSCLLGLAGVAEVLLVSR
jgi:4-hydroxybenzoate polyprenyltransferase